MYILYIQRTRTQLMQVQITGTDKGIDCSRVEVEYRAVQYNGGGRGYILY